LPWACTFSRGFDDSLIVIGIEIGTETDHCFAIPIAISIPIAEKGLAHLVPTNALARAFEPFSDLFLTDTLLLPSARDRLGAQPEQGFVGITGRTCDWEAAAELVEKSRIPVVLAGGIGPENVRDGIARVRPWGVDSCTGTNAADQQGKPIRFRKDLD
jgi:phosphoribosylanthranilate isomerase